MARALRLGRRGRPARPPRGPDPAPPVRAGVDPRGGGRGVLSSAPTSSSTAGSAPGRGATRPPSTPLCDADVHYEDPFTDEPLHGPAAIAARAARLWAAFPDVAAQADRPAPVRRRRTRPRRPSCSARTASRSRASPPRTASSSCTSSSSPSCATSGCTACARSSTSTTRRSSSACCRGAGRSAGARCSCCAASGCSAESIARDALGASRQRPVVGQRAGVEQLAGPAGRGRRRRRGRRGGRRRGAGPASRAASS